MEYWCIHFFISTCFMAIWENLKDDLIFKIMQNTPPRETEKDVEEKTGTKGPKKRISREEKSPLAPESTEVNMEKKQIEVEKAEEKKSKKRNKV